MAREEHHVCDRCRKPFEGGGERRLGRTLTVNYHHPRTLELCVYCEAEFTVWLGRHPGGSGQTIDKILDGCCSGEGYPSQQRVAMLRRERGLPPWCPECLRVQPGHRPGVWESKSDGGTESYSCGHAIGK